MCIIPWTYYQQQVGNNQYGMPVYGQSRYAVHKCWFNSILNVVMFIKSTAELKFQVLNLICLFFMLRIFSAFLLYLLQSRLYEYSYNRDWSAHARKMIRYFVRNSSRFFDKLFAYCETRVPTNLYIITFMFKYFYFCIIIAFTFILS